MWPSFTPGLAAARCRGCDHPRPPYAGGYASVRTRLSDMVSMAKYVGCEVCGVLSRGILAVLEDEGNELGLVREEVEELQLDFNLAGARRSLEVVVVGSGVKVAVFVDEGE